MNRFFLLITFLQLFILQTYAQDHSIVRSGSTYLLSLEYRTEAANSTVEGLTLNEIEGSPYLNKQFSTGYIITNKDSIVGLNLRYNIFNDVIEFEKRDNAFELPYETNYSRVVIGDQVFQKIKFKKSNNSELIGILELMINELHKLYCRRRVHFYPTSPAKAFEEPKPAEFRKQSLTFFYASKNNQPIEFSNKKALIKLLPEELKDKAINHIKKHKTKFKDRNDLLSLFNALNREDTKVE